MSAKSVKSGRKLGKKDGRMNGRGKNPRRNEGMKGHSSFLSQDRKKESRKIGRQKGNLVKRKKERGNEGKVAEERKREMEERFYRLKERKGVRGRMEGKF